MRSRDITAFFPAPSPETATNSSPQITSPVVMAMGQPEEPAKADGA